MEAKRVLDNMSKLQVIFAILAIVCHRYQRLVVLQNVFAFILL